MICKLIRDSVVSVFLGKFVLIPFDATRKRHFSGKDHQTGLIEIYPRKHFNYATHT